MRTLKKWWVEIFIVIGFIPLFFAGKWVEELIKTYDAATPLIVWVTLEILWNLTASLFLHAWIGKGLIAKIRNNGLLNTLKNVSSASRKLVPNKQAWNYFRLNRLVAIVQPITVLITVLVSRLPHSIKLVIVLLTLFDALHTFAIIKRSKTWQTFESNSELER